MERDEQEAELRWVLNYGHTIGHALEAATAFHTVGTWRGGISLGIAAEARLAERLGLGRPSCTKRGRWPCSRGRACRWPGLGCEPAAVVEALSAGQEGRDGRIPFVLAPEIGSFRVVSDVPRDAVLQVLKELV